jgi:hypothetical protein
MASMSILQSASSPAKIAIAANNFGHTKGNNKRTRLRMNATSSRFVNWARPKVRSAASDFQRLSSRDRANELPSCDLEN